MKELFYVFKLGKVDKGSGHSHLSSYGYDPVFIPREPLPGQDPNYVGRDELGPFDSEQDAVDYINTQLESMGPFTILKIYNRSNW